MLDTRYGILIAPIIFVEKWKDLYTELIITLARELSEEVKKDLFFELIFMTYSYVHHAINTEAFPNAINLYHKDLMTSRGRRNVRIQTTPKGRSKRIFKKYTSAVLS